MTMGSWATHCSTMSRNGLRPDPPPGQSLTLCLDVGRRCRSDRLLAATGLDRSPMPASVLFSPIYRANRTPHNDPHMRGGFSRLATCADRAAMTQAVLEGVAFWI